MVVVVVVTKKGYFFVVTVMNGLSKWVFGDV